MTITNLAEFLNKLDNISSRNDLTFKVAEFLKLLSPTEARYVIYFLQGRVAPKFEAQLLL